MRRWLIAVLCLLALLAGGAVGLQDASATAAASPENETGLQLASEEMAVDDTTRITDWSYDESHGEVRIQFNASRPTTVTITEAASAASGRVGELSITRERVLPGNSSVTMAVEPGPAGEVAVVVTTAESLDSEQGVFLSTGQTAPPSPSPFAGTSPTAGWIGGATLSLVTVVLAGIYRMRSEAMEPEVAG